MDSYIVRIYRRNDGDIAGTVEAVEPGTRIGFADGPDLLAILGCAPRVVAVAPAEAPGQAQPPRQQR